MTNAALALSAIVLMSGCPGSTPDGGKVIATTCSPIVISDGATYLKHNKGNNGSHDFRIVSAGGSFQATVTGADKFKYLLCKSNLSANCDASPGTLLSAPWTLKIFDNTTVAGASTLVVTLTSQDNQNVVASYGSGLEVDLDEDNDSDDANNGTKLSQTTYTFNYATFTNYNSSEVTYTCTSSTKCVLEITH